MTTEEAFYLLAVLDERKERLWAELYSLRDREMDIQAVKYGQERLITASPTDRMDRYIGCLSDLEEALKAVQKRRQEVATAIQGVIFRAVQPSEHAEQASKILLDGFTPPLPVDMLQTAVRARRAIDGLIIPIDWTNLDEKSEVQDYERRSKERRNEDRRKRNAKKAR